MLRKTKLQKQHVTESTTEKAKETKTTKKNSKNLIVQENKKNYLLLKPKLLVTETKTTETTATESTSDAKKNITTKVTCYGNHNSKSYY